MSQLVSVIIPTYNRRAQVAEAVESVLAQTYRPVEVMVVDDGSTDGTEEALRPLRGEIRYLSRPNRGPSAARNAGIAASSGELIAFLDSDDVWAPTKLEQQAAVLERAPAVGIVFCDFHYEDASSGVSARIRCCRPELRGDIRRKLLQRCLIRPSTVLLRRACFDRVGAFDEALGGAEDWDLWIRLSRHFEFDFVPEALTTCRVSGDNLTRKTAMMHQCEMRVIRRAFREDPIDGGNLLLRQRTLAFYHFYTGQEYLQARRYRPALRFLVQATALWPFDCRYPAHVAKALCKAALVR